MGEGVDEMKHKIKFSSGPWHACGKGDCCCKQVWCNDHPVAEVTSGEWGDNFPSIRLVGPSLDLKAEAFMDQITYGEISEATATANARLIAMAPEMYDYISIRAEAGDKTAAKIIKGCLEGVENKGAKEISESLSKVGRKP